MPFSISNAVDKLCHADLRLCLSSLRLRLSRFCGLAYHWVMVMLICAKAVMLVVLGLALFGVILAVLMSW